MRLFWAIMLLPGLAQAICCAQPRTLEPAGRLVREVVYNELHDHDHHGYWRYWIKRQTPAGTRLNDQVETADGPVTRLFQVNGSPPDADDRRLEQNRLNDLLASPLAQARHRQEYLDDEKRIGRILALLPDAFLYQYAGCENSLCQLRFHPDPAYPAHSIEARIFHAMSGELWIDTRFKRLVRLDGRLDENVDFGYGILGRLDKGGWFRLQRAQVSATDWKTERLEVHLTGRAILFKTIARETSEERGGFVPVPPGMDVAQGLALLDASGGRGPLESCFKPVSEAPGCCGGTTAMARSIASPSRRASGSD